MEKCTRKLGCRNLSWKRCRLRGAVGRANRAEAELAQLSSEIERRSPLVPSSGASEVNAKAERLSAYLGEAVAPPSNMDVAYTKEGLTDAIEQAARKAGVRLKRVEIESTEFPFLAGVICEAEADFEKLKDQLKTMDAYSYNGSVSSHGCYAFNITPSQAAPFRGRPAYRPTNDGAAANVFGPTSCPAKLISGGLRSSGNGSVVEAIETAAAGKGVGDIKPVANQRRVRPYMVALSRRDRCFSSGRRWNSPPAT